MKKFFLLVSIFIVGFASAKSEYNISNKSIRKNSKNVSKIKNNSGKQKAKFTELTHIVIIRVAV